MDWWQYWTILGQISIAVVLLPIPASLGIAMLRQALKTNSRQVDL